MSYSSAAVQDELHDIEADMKEVKDELCDLNSQKRASRSSMDWFDLSNVGGDTLV